MKAYVGMFRLPGYPWIGDEVTITLDAAFRALEEAEAVDPVDLAIDLAAVLEHAARVIRDYAADRYVETHPDELPLHATTRADQSTAA